MWMHDGLLAFHLIGLMMGAGGGFGSAIIMAAARKAPEDQAMTLRRMGPRLARFSAYGLIIMWVTGVTMTFSMSLISMPFTFWIKLAFVSILTLAAIAVELTYAQVTSGNAKAAARLPILGPLSGISSLLAVIFAVLTFH
jgi:hypothetical protein